MAEEGKEGSKALASWLLLVGEANGHDVVVQCCCPRQLHQPDVILQGVRAVGRVDEEGFGVHLLLRVILPQGAVLPWEGGEAGRC